MSAPFLGNQILQKVYDPSHGALKVFDLAGGGGGGGTSATPKTLGQDNPGPTPVALYVLPSSVIARMTCLRICNTGATAQTFRVFRDPFGETFNQTTALYWDRSLDPNETISDTGSLVLDTAGGSIGCSASSTDVNFFLDGEETAVV